MKLRKAKNEGEALAAMQVQLKPGRGRVEFTSKDGTFSAVRIGHLHIAPGSYGSGIDLSVEQPFDAASRYKVTATVQGFQPCTTYHEAYGDATAKRDSYGDGVTVEFDGTKQVDVLVDEQGNVVREVGPEPAAEPAAPAADPSQDIPF